MYWSVWHRGKSASSVWALIALKGDQVEAIRVFEQYLEEYRSGMVRLVDPAGIVLRRESCHRRVAVPA